MVRHKHVVMGKIPEILWILIMWILTFHVWNDGFEDDLLGMLPISEGSTLPLSFKPFEVNVAARAGAGRTADIAG